MNTKQAILNVALDLFSINGFEATSMSMIAETVGIRKASLYSHYVSKQAILDELFKTILDVYHKQSLFARTQLSFLEQKESATIEALIAAIKHQVIFISHDPYISKARKMLVIEQFKNPDLSDLLDKQNYQDVLDFFAKVIKRLIELDVLKEYDVEIMSAQLCFPINVWINQLDRHPEKEEEILQTIDRHVHQFFEIYQS